MSIHLILGGARSGKSSYAEKQVNYHEAHEQAQVYYLATAQPLDEEMQARIKQHQLQRPDHWQLVESPKNLATTIEHLLLTHHHDKASKKSIVILVDCLTLWLSNCLCSPEKNNWQQEKKSFLKVVSGIKSLTNVHLLLVSNEVGHGIVPLGELSRDFVDHSGWLHQNLAEIATKVDFIMAGIALTLKPASSNLKEYK